MAVAKFVEGDLMRHVTVMSVTASIGLVALFFVDLIDMVFISMLGRTELSAAIGFSGPILFFTTSVGIGMAIATGALVARSLGEGSSETARRYATNVLVVAFVMASFVALIVWFCTPALLSVLGATGETKVWAIKYLNIIIPSTPIIVLGMAAGAILRGHGDANRAMFTTLSGGAVNLVLDPIFIFGFGWGLEGAAFASVLSRVAVLATAIYFVVRNYEGFDPIQLAPLRTDLRPIGMLAMPAVLTNIATPIGQSIVTRSMAGFGDAAVAGMTFVGKLTPVSFAVIFALSGAVGPIVGQNFGAKQYDRVRGTLIASLKFCAIYVVSISALLFLLRGAIADMFSATGEARELIYLFCGPLSLLFFFNGVLFCSNASFNNLNRPFYSTGLNWARNTIGMVLPVWWFAGLFGSFGVLIGQMIGGVVFGLLGLWLAFVLISGYATGRVEPGKKRQVLAWWRARSSLSRSDH